MGYCSSRRGNQLCGSTLSAALGTVARRMGVLQAPGRSWTALHSGKFVAMSFSSEHPLDVDATTSPRIRQRRPDRWSYLFSRYGISLVKDHCAHCPRPAHASSQTGPSEHGTSELLWSLFTVRLPTFRQRPTTTTKKKFVSPGNSITQAHLASTAHARSPFSMPNSDHFTIPTYFKMHGTYSTITLSVHSGVQYRSIRADPRSMAYAGFMRDVLTVGQPTTGSNPSSMKLASSLRRVFTRENTVLRNDSTSTAHVSSLRPVSTVGRLAIRTASRKHCIRHRCALDDWIHWIAIPKWTFGRLNRLTSAVQPASLGAAGTTASPSCIPWSCGSIYVRASALGEHSELCTISWSPINSYGAESLALGFGAKAEAVRSADLTGHD
nr:hypothetical protein CFP56_69083 [Quercus suber]